MAETTTTSTRADDIRRYVELDALELFLVNLLAELGQTELALHEIERYSELDVADQSTTPGTLFTRLWPGEWDAEGVEHSHASAQVQIRVARMFSWLTTPEGQAFCNKQADHFMKNANKSVREAAEHAH